MIIVVSKDTNIIMLPRTSYKQFSNSLPTQILKANNKTSSAQISHPSPST